MRFLLHFDRSIVFEVILIEIIILCFLSFIRKPPLLPKISGCRNLQLHPVIMNRDSMDTLYPYFPRPEIIYTNYMLPNVPQYRETPSANRELSNVVTGPVIEEVRDLDSLSVTSSSNSSSPLSDRSSVLSYCHRSPKRKRIEAPGDNMFYGNEVIPRKLRKTNISSVQRKRTRKQRGQHKETATAIELRDVKESMISLTKQLLPLSPILLQAKQYDVFLEHTIDCITKQTGKSRQLVLSISHDAYCKIDKFKTSRNDTFYFIYAGSCCLVIGNSEFENLRLYTDFARRNLVREIMERFGDKYKEPEALFLSYDGKALLKKKKVFLIKYISILYSKDN